LLENSIIVPIWAYEWYLSQSFKIVNPIMFAKPYEQVIQPEAKISWNTPLSLPVEVYFLLLFCRPSLAEYAEVGEELDAIWVC
jgi:hypothetical protein